MTFATLLSRGVSGRSAPTVPSKLSREDCGTDSAILDFTRVYERNIIGSSVGFSFAIVSGSPDPRHFLRLLRSGS